MKLIRFSLDQRSKFHFGDINEQLEIVPSNQTLFGAFVASYHQLYGQEKVDELINKFQKGEATISSMFLGLSIEEKGSKSQELFFLPKPIAPTQVLADHLYQEDEDYKYKQDMVLLKKLRKARYVSLKVLKNYFQDEGFRLDNLEFIMGDFVCSKDEISPRMRNLLKDESFCLYNERLRSTISRYDSMNKDERALYLEQSVVYRHLTGNGIKIKPFFFTLWDGIMSNEDRACIRYLCDGGLGGKRSLGFGQLKQVEIKELANIKVWQQLLVEARKKNTHAMLLSEFIPRGQQEACALCSYDLKKKGYYKTSKERGVYTVVKEGSLVNRMVQGTLLFEENEGKKAVMTGRAFLLERGV